MAPAWSLPLTEPRAAALARPLIARYTLEVARIEGATALAHGSAFPSADPEGLEAALVAAGADLVLIAPAREWAMDVAALLEFGRERGIPVPSANTRPVMEVRNLWGRSVTADVLDNPDTEPPADLYSVTRGVEGWAKEPSVVEMTFKGGRPIELNGIAMPLVELIVSLDTIAGAHGIGRMDFPAVPGVRPRTIEEAPASTLIQLAISRLAGKDGTVRLTCFMGEAK